MYSENTQFKESKNLSMCLFYSICVWKIKHYISGQNQAQTQVFTL